MHVKVGGNDKSFTDEVVLAQNNQDTQQKKYADDYNVKNGQAIQLFKETMDDLISHVMECLYQNY